MSTLLSINNYYYSRGGAENVFLEHNRLLDQKGWGIVPFSMQHPENIASDWSEHFVDEIEFGNDYSLIEKVVKAPKTVYSFEARSKLDQLLNKTPVDVAHAHNIYHHISPSILGKLHSRGVPTFLTLHDLKIACPAYKMLNSNGICEQCKGGAHRHVVSNRCIKDSLMLSALSWVEAKLHSSLGSYRNHVDKFVVPSQFYIDKFVEWGWPAEKFRYIPNFVDCKEFQPNYAAGDYFVYFGRLSEEKGIATLIDATVSAGIKLRVVGTGPLEAELKQKAKASNADIQFMGYQSGEPLKQLVAQSKAVVVPSEWYENAPLSIMEAYGLGKPVIGAEIGGIPELIRRSETGDIFSSGNADELAKCLSGFNQLPDTEIEQMGREGRRWMEEEFSSDRYVARVLELYQSFGVRI